VALHAGAAHTRLLESTYDLSLPHLLAERGPLTVGEIAEAPGERSCFIALQRGRAYSMTPLSPLPAPRIFRQLHPKRGLFRLRAIDQDCAPQPGSTIGFNGE
jgi:hypothetical protein